MLVLVCIDTVVCSRCSSCYNHQYPPTPTAPDAAPLNLVVSIVDATSASATWGAPRVENQNGEILSYLVNITHTTTGMVQTFSTATTDHAIATLHPDYSYFYSVAAVNSVGSGPFRIQVIRMPEAGESLWCSSSSF